jgi:hypothetical protein
MVRFNQAQFETGIRTAMGVGLPPALSNRPVFVFADTITNTLPADQEHVPFDPTATPVVAAGNQLSGITCAIEYVDLAGDVVDLGNITPTRLKITMLDAEYQLVQGFDHVLMAGDRYFYRRTEPPIGMVDSTVWIIHCIAEDDR